MKTLTLIMGPPGVGKSKLIDYFSSNSNIKTVCWKDIMSLHKNETEENKKKYFYNIINKILLKENNIIISAPLVYELDRQKFFNNINNIDNIRIIGLWVEDSWTNINNSSSEEKGEMSEEELFFLFSHRHSPKEQTFYYNIYYISQLENLAISKKRPFLTSIERALDNILQEL